ncbi:DUF2325 domain-containing protein [Burkholderia sp. WAC0059]|uniref:DUF2325 domain-containing protein n=1 Tax=Burkholderia sp. WAC0059 TaxID=2066022 RepID=UPI000C7F052B|nr:DUF2325 domain-containing protein [Burkholderia sp. WAC0059]PLZ04117.1 DUF2325 domain-containing protein [Burkholderia sp. WAC0059]
MHAPPFRLARTPGLESPDDAPYLRALSGDACCEPTAAEIDRPGRRARLADLDSHLHCSIIGTCLSTHELRKLVPKFANLDARHASDLEIHHAAVELAIHGGPGCKALQKALDTRYAGAVRLFASARDPQALLERWNDALASGDIPPAYWALMTHPQATLEVRQAAFGELHMLSHLVGAANRADIRRLVALEKENVELRTRMERQQARLHEMSMQRDAALAELAAQAARPPAPADDAQRQAEVAALREALAARDARLALQTSRRETAEQRAAADEATAHTLRAQLDDAHALVNALQAEAGAMELAMQQTEQTPSNDVPVSLAGKRIVYVGGRPGSNQALKRWVTSAGGELAVHDGGIEDRKGLLASTLAGADLAVFPVDCIDHDSMNQLKRVCERHQVAYYPLRTASVASFVELMTRLMTTGGDAASATAASILSSAQPASRFCLRHG